MVKVCCVVNCKTVWTLNSDVTFHRFPKDETLRQKWLSAIPLNLLKNKNITKYTTICSKHFTPESFALCTLSTNLKNILHKNSIPTIFKSDHYQLNQFEIAIATMSNKETSETSELFKQEKANLPSVSNKIDIGVQTLIRQKSGKAVNLEKKYKIENLTKRLKRRDEKIKKLEDLLRIAAREGNNAKESGPAVRSIDGGSTKGRRQSGKKCGQG